MFPVTLEFRNEVATLFPPCYGFLKHNQWDGGGDSDYEISYEHIQGWHYQFEVGKEGTSNLEYGCEPEEEVLSDVYDLSSLCTIWNSGTHYPMWGVGYFGGDPHSEQFHSEVRSSNVSNPVCEPGYAKRPLNNVEVWASKEGNDSTVTTKRVMELFDNWLDKDLPSCFEWQDNGCFGVQASANADRCLFYLMLNRSLNCQSEYDNTATLLDLIYKQKVNPIVALFTSRIIVNGTKSLTGKEKVQWVGNDYDSCIFPISLITTGICSRYEEPVQIAWRQDPYTKGQGHKRDEDYPNLSYERDDMPKVNNSMFLPILYPELCGVTWKSKDEECVIKSKPFLIDFCRAISLDDETFERLHKNRLNRVDFYGAIQCLSSGTSYVENNFSVVPSEQWIELVVNLLTSK